MADIVRHLIDISGSELGLMVRITRYCLFYFLIGAVQLALSQPADAQQLKAKTESRRQAVLKVTGTFLPSSGGLRVTVTPTTGPGTNMELPGAATPTRGILDVGDEITEIEGKKFSDQRAFLDLMNEASKQNNGKVRITVKDVNTGKAQTWIVTPEIVIMDVPLPVNNFLTELGDPVAVAPDVPLLPAIIFN